MMLAALMVLGTSAMAQSETLKGDVNADGVVDVADIAAVIAIMSKEAEDEPGVTKYYWYAGQEMPADMTSNPTPDDVNYTANKWHTLADGIDNHVGSTFIGKTITGGVPGNDWYVAVPTIKGLKPTAGDLVTPNTSWDIVKTITVNNVEYTVWLTNSQSSNGRQAVYMANTEKTYYWYVGQENPANLDESFNPEGVEGWTKLDSTPKSIDVSTKTSDGSKVQWYLACPSQYGFDTSVNGVKVGGWDIVRNAVEIGGVKYDVWTCQAIARAVNTTLAKI